MTLSNLQNHFLVSLPPQDSDLLRPHLREQPLTQRSVLFRAQEQMDRIYFPTDGVISLVVALSDGFMVEAACLVATVLWVAGALSMVDLP